MRGDIKPKIETAVTQRTEAYVRVQRDRLSAWRDLQAPFTRPRIESRRRSLSMPRTKVRGALSRHCRAINQRRSDVRCLRRRARARYSSCTRRETEWNYRSARPGHRTHTGWNRAGRGDIAAGWGTGKDVFLTDCAMLLAKIRTRTGPRQSSFKVLPAIYHWSH